MLFCNIVNISSICLRSIWYHADIIIKWFISPLINHFVITIWKIVLKTILIAHGQNSILLKPLSANCFPKKKERKKENFKNVVICDVYSPIRGILSFHIYKMGFTKIMKLVPKVPIIPKKKDVPLTICIQGDIINKLDLIKTVTYLKWILHLSWLNLWSWNSIKMMRQNEFLGKISQEVVWLVIKILYSV